MISDNAFNTGYAALAAVFGDRLQSEATMHIYREELLPIMSDATWQRTVRAALQNETFPPTIAKLIEIADEQRGQDGERREREPSLVAQLRLRSPSVTDKNLGAAQRLMGMMVCRHNGSYFFQAVPGRDPEQPDMSLEQAAQQVEQKRLTASSPRMLKA